MNEQQASPNKAVVKSSIALIVAAVALGAALYYLDGIRVVSEFVSTQWSRILGSQETPAVSSIPTETPDAISSTRLELPPGMPEGFALRIWQEHLDSQKMIRLLAQGDVTRLDISSVETKGDRSTLKVRALLDDGTDVGGQIRMSRFSGVWYVASVSAGQSAKTQDSPLPGLGDVDIQLLNTIIAEQSKSRATTQEYVDGRVTRVDTDDPELGDKAIRIPVTMYEDHETASGDLVLVSYDDQGTDVWFVARLVKTESVPTGP
jgi:hypothetical protein